MENKKACSKSRSGLKKFLIIFLIILISYTLISMGISVIIFKTVFSGKQTSAPYEISYNDIEKERYPREEVWFDSGNNKLFGVIYPSESLSRGLVLVLNGINCTIDRHLPEIQFFTDNGFSVMTFDYTGTGKSGGSGMNGLSQARIDTDAALDYIEKDPQLSACPVFLYGHSLGGYASAAVLNDKVNVCASVSISGFDSPNENMLYTARRYVGLLADIQYPFMCLENYFLFGDIADSSAVEGINSSDIPIMIVAGNSDDIIPEEISILGKSEEIRKDDVHLIEITEPYRGEHNTAWLCSKSAKYIEENEYPDDKSLANQLDETLMDSIIEFYMDSSM